MSSLIINSYQFVPQDPTLILHEGFESGGTPSGWTGTGVDFGYATAPAPLAGSFSLYGAASNSVGAKVFGTVAGELHGYFIYNTALSASSQGVLEIYAAATRQFRVRTLSAGTLRVYQTDGTTTAGTSAAVITAGTNAHIWFRYLKGTGADGQLDLWVSANATKPGSTTLSLTNLTATVDADEIRFPVLVAGTSCIWDNVVIRTTTIGSDPY